ncbi:Serine/threonine protein kinase [Micromonospora halophytica]|uniref:non-specific serine/threonine protein kinase n=1 Tax=Micromonospora halophytica TaxID=47864 RepID=A0A1C5IB50_9ACTN|nr:Serine/threonine protein kinase [Micromonospora halophytica]
MQARDRIGGRYELTYPIGRGGMGQVWAGYDERLDRPVAVKFLRKMEVPADERDTAVKRFRREARATARLDHPGVPSVYDLGEHGDDLYLVMQLIRGTDLADLIAEQGPLDVGQATSIASQLCCVLDAAHEAALVHRDLKPQNLMVTAAGMVKVLDFGVAALIAPAEASRLTATGSTLGTPAYIAPEQATGEQVGPAADLYAVGCVLFEMLTGEPPYQASNAADMLRLHARAPVPVIIDRRPDVPEDIAHLLLCLLAKSPRDRPASARDVDNILRPFRDDHVTYQPDTRAPHHQRTPTISTTGASGVDLSDLRNRVRELAEQERFAQAAEVLEGALRSADRSQPAQLIALRVDLADLRALVGDVTRARREFADLAQELAQVVEHAELAAYCRERAEQCHIEWLEAAVVDEHPPPTASVTRSN